mmetsp:Transcript_5333/g.11602  ORF Transcript_5333/g.11602 Transcript_5333/m.11602 type:complete len:257 (-) Transcript_5333:371-1141(-)
MSSCPRPKSAYASYSMSSNPYRSTRAAGVSCILDQGSVFDANTTRSTRSNKHALLEKSPYAEVAPRGWTRREPLTQPTWKTRGAGTISLGSVDNTYLPKPLKNAWGKSRELAQGEQRVMPHKQATDLLVVAKGGRMPAPVATTMPSVSDPFAATIPMLHSMDPQRLEAGFVRNPNGTTGAAPPPESPMRRRPASAPRLSQEEILERKRRYEQQWTSYSSVPVQKNVTKMQRPKSAQPHFMRTFAGLPGGLALIQPQ